jgi:hypothetical protein
MSKIAIERVTKDSSTQCECGAEIHKPFYVTIDGSPRCVLCLELNDALPELSVCLLMNDAVRDKQSLVTALLQKAQAKRNVKRDKSKMTAP